MDRVKKIIHYRDEDIWRAGYTGKNIGVAVLDTGIASHPDFKGRITAFQDCVSHRQELYDDSGHGTHVAGILAGSGYMSKGILAGMAPEAKLVIVKVLDGNGEGSVSQIATGIEWVAKNWRRYGIRIVNISVGAKAGLDRKKENMLIAAVERLWDAGLTVVVSAGNYGPEAGTVTVPGTSRKVITVGALYGGKKGEDCSGQGPTGECVVKPDVVAPGYQILSCNSLASEKKKPYVAKSGTSMAAPVVSGAIAQLLSVYPDMRNVEIKLRLRESSKREAGMAGWGCIQADRFLMGMK